MRQFKILRLIFHVLAMAAITSQGQAALANPPEIQFNRDIRPILSDNCFYCHGPDKNHREAELRLDDRDAALKAGVIKPGMPGESELVARIRSADKDEVMPPPHANKKLTNAQKDLLARWVEQGAAYQKHWSYEAPVKPTVPAGQNGVDDLVQKRLAAIGLKPSARADKRTLMRRVYFDLIGLPPSPENLQRFLNDKSPRAYENMVEELFANAHHGEKMAIAWLDTVRFADTIGYHSDNPRNVWPYRDWVIESFNKNKPFDQFTVEQIAGDLLPGASQESRVGSAFNRLLLSTEEGGAQPKDYRARMLTDRVRAVGTVWLGQTTGCAQCHDHKFDPFTTRNFYQMAAFFADVNEADIGRREDGMPVPTINQARKLADLDQSIAGLKASLKKSSADLATEQAAWEESLRTNAADLAKLEAAPKASAAAKKKANELIALIKKSPAQRTDTEKAQLADYFLANVTRQFASQRQSLNDLQKQRDALLASTPKCLVTTVRENPLEVRILPRGDWLNETGDVVGPAFPEYLPRPNLGGRTPSRLDLARWLVSNDNPLTARVFVNRLMAQFFGKGLSKVLDDLGTQGEPPANAELLDWLACEFMNSGWDIRHILRTIVTSETYKQVSTASPELRQRDPDNRELARQTPLRLDAEIVRDNALFISGLLDLHIGGPSVKPYQPDGYWENLNFPVRSYDSDTGPAQYRRGLYTWWQRSFLHPSMLAFDAPSREECVAERTRLNLPQQALVLMNDPTYVEAARSFASRILQNQPKASPEKRLDWAFRQALQRSPEPAEATALLDLLQKQRTACEANPNAADQLLKTGLAPVPAGLHRPELAAWTHLARVLLNLHETITRE
ncbi:MAG: PSD1 and planctomycete cytochrome C domain-containing protein [bacterium]